MIVECSKSEEILSIEVPEEGVWGVVDDQVSRCQINENNNDTRKDSAISNNRFSSKSNNASWQERVIEAPTRNHAKKIIISWKAVSKTAQFLGFKPNIYIFCEL